MPASYPRRLMMRWSPISTVFSIEPLGITRACATLPSIRMNASITQNQETISRQTRSFFGGVFFFLISTGTISPASAFTMSLYFELHQLRRIVAGVARGAKFSFGVFERRAQRFERKIAQRVRAQELPDFFDGLLR